MGTRGPARAVVELVLAGVQDGMSVAEASEVYRLSRETTRNIVLGRTRGRPEPPADRAERWTAACLEPAEWTAWQRANRLLTHSSQAARPCDDCLAGFAADMRAEGRCNGVPGEPRERLP